jgi:hypothetical protein
MPLKLRPNADDKTLQSLVQVIQVKLQALIATCYEAVELIETLLSADFNGAMSVSCVDDLRRLTMSNCCFVCWCMSLRLS